MFILFIESVGHRVVSLVEAQSCVPVQNGHAAIPRTVATWVLARMDMTARQARS
ncbi:hypothetical protein [Streptomyces mirabilis]